MIDVCPPPPEPMPEPMPEPAPEPMLQACEGSWTTTNDCVEECNVAQVETLSITTPNVFGGQECRETDDLPTFHDSPMQLVSSNCPAISTLHGCPDGAIRRETCMGMLAACQDTNAHLTMTGVTGVDMLSIGCDNIGCHLPSDPETTQFKTDFSYACGQKCGAMSNGCAGARIQVLETDTAITSVAHELHIEFIVRDYGKLSSREQALCRSSADRASSGAIMDCLTSDAPNPASLDVGSYHAVQGLMTITSQPSGYVSGGPPPPPPPPPAPEGGGGGMVGVIVAVVILGGGAFWLKSHIFFTPTGVKFSWKKTDLFDLDKVDNGIYADQAGMDLETL